MAAELTHPWIATNGLVSGAVFFPQRHSPPPWLWLKEPFNFGGALFAHFDLGDAPGKLDRAPYGANMAFKRRMFEKHGGFRTDLGPRPGVRSAMKTRSSAVACWRRGRHCVTNPRRSSTIRFTVTDPEEYFLDLGGFDDGRAEICEMGQKADVPGNSTTVP